MPIMTEKVADVPKPSAPPATPACPASVETIPVAMSISRIVLLKSTTYSVVSEAAMEPGFSNLAEVAGPSTLPRMPMAPATVDTRSLAMSTARIAWFVKSATYSVAPSWESSTSIGAMNWALFAVPSEDPGVPPCPASVDASPVSVLTVRTTLLTLSPTNNVDNIVDLLKPIGLLNMATDAGPSRYPMLLPDRVTVFPAQRGETGGRLRPGWVGERRPAS